MRYFKKSNIKTTIFHEGNQIVFTPIPDEYGILELADDAPELKTIEICLKRHIGGVVEISKEIYDELKKKQLTSPPSQSIPQLRIVDLSPHWGPPPKPQPPQQQVMLSPAQPAVAQASAEAAVVKAAPATSAGVLAGEGGEPISRGVKVKVGRPKKAT